MTAARMDYVAIKDGNAYALMSADHVSDRDVRKFYQENRGAEIRRMPTSEAVEMHLAYLERRSLLNQEKQG